MSEQSAATATPVIKVTFFGDSTCVGQGVSIYQGWVTKIARYLDEYGASLGCDILVTNSSINGRTTRQALEDMPYHVQSQAPEILVVQFGLNDCNCWATDRGLPRVSLPAFLANLREIISRAQRFGAHRVLLNNNHPTSRDSQIMPDTDFTYEASNRRYNAAIREMAPGLPAGVSFQDIEHHFRSHLIGPEPIEKYLLADGLHLSTAGHDCYYELMLPTIRQAVDDVVAAQRGVAS